MWELFNRKCVCVGGGRIKSMDCIKKIPSLLCFKEKRRMEILLSTNMMEGPSEMKQRKITKENKAM